MPQHGRATAVTGLLLVTVLLAGCTGNTASPRDGQSPAADEPISATPSTATIQVSDTICYADSAYNANSSVEWTLQQTANTTVERETLRFTVMTVNGTVLDNTTITYNHERMTGADIKLEHNEYFKNERPYVLDTNLTADQPYRLQFTLNGAATATAQCQARDT